MTDRAISAPAPTRVKAQTSIQHITLTQSEESPMQITGSAVDASNNEAMKINAEIEESDEDFSIDIDISYAFPEYIRKKHTDENPQRVELNYQLEITENEDIIVFDLDINGQEASIEMQMLEGRSNKIDPSTIQIDGDPSLKTSEQFVLTNWADLVGELDAEITNVKDDGSTAGNWKDCLACGSGMVLTAGATACCIESLGVVYTCCVSAVTTYAGTKTACDACED